VVDLWNEILPDDFIQRPRMSRIYYEGKFYSYPLRAFEALWNLGIFRSTLCMLSYAKAKAFPKKDVRSFQDWVVNQFGFTSCFRSSSRPTPKRYGACRATKCRRTGRRSASRGLSLGAAVMDGLKRSLGLNKKPNDGMETKTLLETFRYPRLGPGHDVGSRAGSCRAKGNHVLMAHALEAASQRSRQRLDRRPPARRWRAGQDQRRACHQLRADARTCRPDRAEAADDRRGERLNYRDFLTVALMIRSDDLFPDNWIYIHDSKVLVGRVQNFRSWSPEMVPDPSIACVGLEYFCFEGDKLWASADADLSSSPRRKWRSSACASRRTSIGGAVVRQEKAYPVYDDGYADNVAAMRTSWKRNIRRCISSAATACTATTTRITR
jgi:protoporphyrinogen oxidase